jgi:4-hydroxy-tetrahydrodipicolinate reductase
MEYQILIAGLPGKMGHAVATEALARNFKLLPWAMTGKDIAEGTIQVNDCTLELLHPESVEAKLKTLAPEVRVVAIDYTHPTAVNPNALFYIRNNIPFVMGTTGGDRAKLMDDLKTSGIPCVVAPNMAKQIVALQWVMKTLAQEFPGVFTGYNLSVVESHQSTKADTSGTAKAMVDYFNQMGVKYDAEEIVMIRDEDMQRDDLGIPEEHLTGHAFHTYTLNSEDETAQFVIEHNILGRSIYAKGTIDALAFLLSRLANGDSEQSQIYDMIDVLKSGNMQ